MSKHFMVDSIDEEHITKPKACKTRIDDSGNACDVRKIVTPFLLTFAFQRFEGGRSLGP